MTELLLTKKTTWIIQVDNSDKIYRKKATFNEVAFSMENILHILNGDSTISSFEKSGINGEYIVWREVLSEGPINYPFNSNEFWTEREKYLTKAFEIPDGEFESTIKAPFQRIFKEINQYSEICLWFEYDLFCQINMIALIGYIGKISPKNLQLTLACAGEVEGSEKLHGLGELSPEQFSILFDSRLKMGTRETEYAQEVFVSYCSDDAEGLYNYVLMPFNEFKYLSSALEAHLKRFPFSDSGLNEIEQKIISLIENGIHSERQLVGRLLKWQEFYGFGDLQYFNIINSLTPLFSDYKNLKLKENLSSDQIEGLLDRDQQLGGAWLKDWVYDIEEKTLIPRSQRSE